MLEDGENVFLTGAAGTGKSYLFRYLRQELRKAFPAPAQVATTAPTGIAAINVGGVTIHSWSGVGLGRGSADKLVASVTKSRKASARWRACKVLLIDEISMLDSELFSSLALVGAAVRGVEKPFGGLQLVCCGDFHQLPPVGLGNFGKTFCFGSRAWRDLEMRSVVLTEVIRQRGDQPFIAMLNEIRKGRLLPATSAALAACHVSCKPLPTDGILPTKLLCKNRGVDAENLTRLGQLPGTAVVFAARDRFKGNAVSDNRARTQVLAAADSKVPGTLSLKVGAQVVLLRNLDAELGLANGSRGVVLGFEPSQGSSGGGGGGGYGHVPMRKGAMRPLIKFDSGTTLHLETYEVFVGKGQAGSVTRVQLPLKLAWALTVHKSQGMSLTRCMVEVADAFDYGQVYVALSRAESRQGLWLSGGTINQGVVRAHPDVLAFPAASDAGGVRARQTEEEDLFSSDNDWAGVDFDAIDPGK